LGEIGPLLSMLGIVIVAICRARQIHGAILIGIVSVWIIAIITGNVAFNGFFHTPPSIAPVFFKLDLIGAMDLWIFTQLCL